MPPGGNGTESRAFLLRAPMAEPFVRQVPALAVQRQQSHQDVAGLDVAVQVPGAMKLHQRPRHIGEDGDEVHLRGGSVS